MVQDYLRRNVFQLALTALVFALALMGHDLDAQGNNVLVAGTVGGIATATFEMEEAMKVLFEDSLEVNVVHDSELLDLFEKDTNVQSETTGGGRYIETAHLFGLPAGYGYRTESDAIPVPRGPQIENARIYLKKSMGSVSITGDVFSKIKSGKEAFTSWAKQQFPEFAKRIANEKDRIMLGYGTGVKARISAISGNLVTVNRALGVTGYSNAILQFMANEDIAAGPNVNGTGLRANAAAGNNYHVVNTKFATSQLQLNEATNLVVGDYLFGADEHGVSTLTAAGKAREFMGLLGHVDNGGILLDYFGIARDEHDAWGATVVDISNAAAYGGVNGQFDDLAILYGDMQARLRAGAEIDVLISPYAGALEFWKSLREDRTLNDPKSWTGGGGKLYVRIRDKVVEVRGARKMPAQIAFGLTKGTFKRYTLGKFEWSTRTGSLWQQVIAGGRRYDAFWAYGHDHDEIFCKSPDKNIRFEGLA